MPGARAWEAAMRPLLPLSPTRGRGLIPASSEVDVDAETVGAGMLVYVIGDGQVAHAAARVAEEGDVSRRVPRGDVAADDRAELHDRLLRQTAVLHELVERAAAAHGAGLRA